MLLNKVQEDPANKICPHIGLFNDPKTTSMFPVSDHACYRASPPAPVALDYQRSCCLTNAHVECPGYQKGWTDNFPKELRGHKLTSKKVGQHVPKWALFLGLGLFLMVIIIGAVFQLSADDTTPPATLAGNIMISTPTETAFPTQSPTLLPSPTMTIEPSPTMSITPAPLLTQTPGPALQTPFGTSALTFAIHQAQPGETLSIIAEQYGTSEDVLLSINQFIPPERTSLWQGDVLVVCVDCLDSSDLPKLQALYVESQISITELASNYNTSIEEIRMWNDLGENDLIAFPRWLIVRAS